MKKRILLGSLWAFGSFGCTAKQDETPVAAVPTSGAQKPTTGEQTPVETPKPAKPTAIIGPNARTLCVRPSGQDGKPRSIADVIKLINALPKPVSVPCFIDVLERPLALNATGNVVSGQPAGGSDSPRIFLMLGDKLSVSIVPSGQGGTMMEFGETTEPGYTVKGEIEVPVLATLADDAPYTHILRDSGDGTNCGFCHFPEIAAPAGFPPNAYASRLVPPFEMEDVTLRELQAINTRCQTTKAEACLTIQALFVGEAPVIQAFDSP